MKVIQLLALHGIGDVQLSDHEFRLLSGNHFRGALRLMVTFRRFLSKKATHSHETQNQ
ncbi:MAG: hypothetical protein IJR74_04795 [Paludibacteraceae bacterium]|nr:hypothetical protein [Paludibacteraceae bacterium]